MTGAIAFVTSTETPLLSSWRSEFTNPATISFITCVHAVNLTVTPVMVDYQSFICALEKKPRLKEIQETLMAGYTW